MAAQGGNGGAVRAGGCAMGLHLPLPSESLYVKTNKHAGA